MSGRETAEVLALVLEERSQIGDLPAVVGWLQRMCRAAARDLPATGVGVSLISETGARVGLAASSPGSALVEELQFSLGEGPCLSAYNSRGLVLVPDLAGAAGAEWPGYTLAASEHHVRAVFAFPLQVGDARLGALDVYRDHVGQLTAHTLARALTFAEVALNQLLDTGTTTHGTTALLGDPFHDHEDVRYEVYQAQGMVMIQLAVEADEAMARLRAQAFARGTSLVRLAHDVINRRVALERDGS